MARKIPKMKLEFILPIALAIIVMLLSVVYWHEATRVTPSQCEAWPNTCERGYVPWPWTSDERNCIDMAVHMEPIDQFICNLVRTRLYVLVVVFQIVAAAWLGRFVVRRIVAPFDRGDDDD